MRIVALLLMLVGVAWFIWSVTVTILWANLTRRLKGLEEPALWLPKAERREHARKLLHRQDEQYEQQMMERLTNYMKEGNK